MIPLDDYNKALRLVESTANRLTEMAEAFDVLVQPKMAAKLTLMAGDLYRAGKKLSEAARGMAATQAAAAQEEECKPCTAFTTGTCDCEAQKNA